MDAFTDFGSSERAMEKEAEGERRRADTAEALAKNHEEEMLRCKEVLEKALAELEAKTRKNATLEQRVAEFVEETAKLRIECDEARTCLTKALEDLEALATIPEAARRYVDGRAEVRLSAETLRAAIGAPVEAMEVRPKKRPRGVG